MEEVFPDLSYRIGRLRGPGVLVYAAIGTCPCGAGLAYPLSEAAGDPIAGWWTCSAVLLGEAEGDGHTDHLSFSDSTVMPETHPSAATRGITTRPVVR